MAKKTKLKAKYKIRRFLLILLLLALVGGGGWYLGQSGMLSFGLIEPEGPGPQPQTDDLPRSTDPAPADTQADEEEDGEEEEAETPPELRVSTGDWNLILVNSVRPLPEDFTVELETVYENYKVDARIAKSALEMFNAARLDGVTIFPCSAYRAVDYQQGLFDDKVEEYVAAGYSMDLAVSETATIIAVPGTSEHHTGLAVDIVTTDYQVLDEGFAETAAFRWLDQNAHKYGFVLRYPKDKQQITGIIYEPWHYRYVGEEHAAIIKERAICLEEYVEILEDLQYRLTHPEAQEEEDGQEQDGDEGPS